MIDKNRLEQKCSMWNIALTGEQLDQLDAFAQILVDYNQKVNLTAITDPEGIEDKHFLDSQLFASSRQGRWWSGAGSGIVTKIYKPELELTPGWSPLASGWSSEGCLPQLSAGGVSLKSALEGCAAGSSLIRPLPVRWFRPAAAEYRSPLGGSFAAAMKGASWRGGAGCSRGAIRKPGGEAWRPHLHLPGGDTRTLILCKDFAT